MDSGDQFKSKELVDLNAPGIKKNSVYYTKRQIEIQNVELNTTIGRYSQSLTSLQFGSTSQIIIPNNDILHQVYLHVILTPTVANQTLPMGWMYDLISEINFSWGSANISNLRISGKSVRHINLWNCETEEKRLEVLRLAGEPLNVVSTKPVEGVICIPLPWSNISSSLKKGFDCSILNNSIQIQITLKSADSIYGGTATPPTAITSGTVFLRQSYFTDRSNSLKFDLMNNPQLMYQYPFMHHSSPSPKYNILCDDNTTTTIELNEFINSDLIGIVFSLHRTDLQSRTGTNAPNAGLSVECTDIELQYNGQSVFKCPGKSARLIQMSTNSPGAAGKVNDVIFGQISPWTESPVNSYAYYIPFGERSLVDFQGKFDNTARYNSQTMHLSIKPQKFLASDASLPCELHCTYVYNAICSIQSGVSNITFS